MGVTMDKVEDMIIRWKGLGGRGLGRKTGEMFARSLNIYLLIMETQIIK